MTLTDTPPLLDVFVPGRPAPQGSKRAFVNQHTGRAAIVESSKAVKPWRSDIRDHIRGVLGDGHVPIDGPVWVELEFVMPRPASTPKRSTPPAIKRPDIEKLARAVADALQSAGVYRDDSQIVRMILNKRLAEIGEHTGCRIAVRRP